MSRWALGQGRELILTASGPPNAEPEMLMAFVVGVRFASAPS